MKAWYIGFVFGLASFFSLPVLAQQAPNFNVGATPYDLVFSARARSFGNTSGNELYAGVGDLGIATNRAERGINWILGDNPLTLTYDGGTLISLSAGGSSVVYTLDNAQRAAGLDIITLTLWDRTSNGDVVLNNLAIDTGLGSTLLTSSLLVSQGGSSVQAYINGADFSRGFQLTGVLRLTGLNGAQTPNAAFGSSQEASRLDFYAGRSLAQAVSEPATLALFGLGLIGIGLLVKRP